MVQARYFMTGFELPRDNANQILNSGPVSEA
jgi:hypothetical protein